VIKIKVAEKVQHTLYISLQVLTLAAVYFYLKAVINLMSSILVV